MCHGILQVRNFSYVVCLLADNVRHWLHVAEYLTWLPLSYLVLQTFEIEPKGKKAQKGGNEDYDHIHNFSLAEKYVGACKHCKLFLSYITLVAPGLDPPNAHATTAPHDLRYLGMFPHICQQRQV